VWLIVEHGEEGRVDNVVVAIKGENRVARSKVCERLLLSIGERDQRVHRETTLLKEHLI
jgi:hypothetical protein